MLTCQQLDDFAPGLFDFPTLIPKLSSEQRAAVGMEAQILQRVGDVSPWADLLRQILELPGRVVI
jgi:hypothetical protein